MAARGFVELAGLRVAEMTRLQVVNHIFESLESGRGGWLITATLDYLRQCAANPATRELFGCADLIVADGMPLIWAARLQGTPLPDRVAGSDLVWLIAERAALEGCSLYLLGGAPGAAVGAQRRLLERWPELRIAGCSAPELSADPDDAELRSIRADLRRASPDLVYVGLGAPKQDRVIALLRGDHPHAWFLGVGMSLSFLAGSQPRAPLWMQRAGLEWLHRLAREPRRLGRRYLLLDLPFACRLLGRALRSR